MATYLIESPHSPRECVWVLRQIVRDGDGRVTEYEWGCRDGVHTCWAIVEAETKFDVLASVPQALRSQARIVQLNRFTVDEVVAFHEAESGALGVGVGAR